jgi:hypothetical protein
MKKLIYLFGIALLLVGCKEEENPFPTTASDNGSGGSSIAANSIAGLHKNIFEPKCAIPSCHGGTFEPDFRSVESTYFTLVYQPVVKNTIDEKYTYRVVPRDTVRSWLFHRVTVQDTLIPRMPIYMDALSDEDIGNIKSWIMAGAPDARGVLPVKANLPPAVYGYNAYDAGFNRIDELRASWSTPFPAPYGQQIHFWVFADDEETETKNLKVNQMKFSLDPNDFSNAVTSTAVWMNGPVCWGWVVSVNTNQFPQGSTVYMRYYVKDPILNQTIEMPKSTSYSWFKTNFSFTL